MGEFLAELGRRLGMGAAAVEAVVPAVDIDILDEAEARFIVGELADDEGIGVPAVEDVADVEDDGGGALIRHPGLDPGSRNRSVRESSIAVCIDPDFRQDDGVCRQPWRALKRRLVLLMT